MRVYAGVEDAYAAPRQALSAEARTVLFGSVGR
jgi:hypothetical protein